MKVDKKSVKSLNNVLQAVFSLNKDFYGEFEAHGKNSNILMDVESLEGQERILKDKSFLEKIFNVSEKYNGMDFSGVQEKIQSKMESNNKMLVEDSKIDSFFGKSLFGKMSDAISTITEDQPNITLSDEKAEVVANEISKARKKELCRSYLQLKDVSLLSAPIHLLAKGIKNIEKPSNDNLIPDRVNQEVGMLQIGLALNHLATTPLNRAKSKEAYNKDLSVKRLAQSSSNNQTEFLDSCKTLARNWESKNIKLLTDLSKKQDAKKERSLEKRVDKDSIKDDVDEKLIKELKAEVGSDPDERPNKVIRSNNKNNLK